MKEEDKKAECIVNRIQGEMEDLVTWEEVELSTSQHSRLQAVMEAIKTGTLRNEARMEKYKECYMEFSSADKVVIVGEGLVFPQDPGA